MGGVQALLEADLPAEQNIDADAMNTAVQIVENRVNGLGVTEAVVQKAGDRRIVVEIPGQTDPEQALAVLNNRLTRICRYEPVVPPGSACARRLNH